MRRLYLGCMLPIWTPIEATCHVDEAYAAEQGIHADYDPTTLEAIARAMDADPEYLEATWSAWKEEMEGDKVPEEEIDAARYWLDVTLIGGLANP